MSDIKPKPENWLSIMVPIDCDWEAAGMNLAKSDEHPLPCSRCANFRQHRCLKHGVSIVIDAEQKRFSCHDWVENRQAKPKIEYEQHDVAPGYQVVSPKQEAAMPKPNQGKPQYHFLDPLFMAEIAKVLEFGAQKYEAWNWTKGYPYSTIYDSCQRHLTAWWMGEDCDPESGISHLAHAGCNLMFLARFHLARPDSCSGAEDDRPAMLLPELLTLIAEKELPMPATALPSEQEFQGFVHHLHLLYKGHTLAGSERYYVNRFCDQYEGFAIEHLKDWIYNNGLWGDLTMSDNAAAIGDPFYSCYRVALKDATEKKEKESK